MLQWLRNRARISLVAVAGLVLVLAPGCEDDPSGPGEPQIGILRLTIGTQRVEITAGTGAATGAPILIPLGGLGAAITAQPLHADGSIESQVNAVDFELLITSANTTLVTYTRVGALNGTLNGLVRGSTTLEVAIRHGDHNDFGPHNVAITIQ